MPRSRCRRVARAFGNAEDGAGQVISHVDPERPNGGLKLNGKMLGGFEPPAAVPAGAGSEGGEELTTLQISMAVMAPLAASGAILAYHCLAAKPALDAVLAAPVQPYCAVALPFIISSSIGRDGENVRERCGSAWDASATYP